MELFKDIVTVAGGISTFTAAVCLLVKPLRKWIFGDKQARDGLKCLLRSDMLRTYYRHRDEGKIRQYEYENFALEYKAYKALKGNSFIDKVAADVKAMKVES